MGIDIGTTSLKAAVFDETGVRHGFCCEDYTLNTDPDSGFIEYDPEGYVQMCRNVIGRLRDECGPIDAISVDTQGETMVFADVDGKPLYPAIVWLDNRATQEADEIKERFGVRQVYEVTGQPEITAGWPACKALWFRKRHPELWSRTGKIFLLEDWILFRLTGNFVTEPTVQSSSIWLDITTRRWWPEMLDFLGLDAGMLPEIHRSGEVVGTYEGIPVVAGALDQIAGSIGAGVTDGRRVSEMTGTIMAICAMTDHIPAFREDSIIPCHLHAIEGKYTLILWSSTAGMALKWFKNQLAENFSFQDLDALAEAVPAGCDGLSMLPYFCGSTMPRYNPEARAVFSGINLSHTRGHFARSIMEAVAFVLKQDLDYIGAENVREIRITGGGASSRLWSQIKADVTRKTLKTVSESETACLGSAILAAVGIGAFPSIEEAAEIVASPRSEYIPGDTDYTAAYERFCSLDNTMNG